MVPKAGLIASGGHANSLHVVVTGDMTVSDLLQFDRPRLTRLIQRLGLILFCDKRWCPQVDFRTFSKHWSVRM
jgi:hypothetical protein